MGPVKPAALTRGTVVELRDLFHATPARLKFLRSDRAEMQAITDVVKRLAMAEPAIGFTLRDADGDASSSAPRPRRAISFDALHTRLSTVLGREFAENALAIDAEREGMRLTGYAALPTYSRGPPSRSTCSSTGARCATSFSWVRCARPTWTCSAATGIRRRRCLSTARPACGRERAPRQVRGALPRARVARGLIVSGLRHALAEAGHRASSTVAGATLGAITPATGPRVYQMDRPRPPRWDRPPAAGAGTCRDAGWDPTGGRRPPPASNT
jgi:DNA mismatch repair protein MutL